MFAVFTAAKEDYEGGYIFSLRGLVKAEVLSDALEQAEELLNSGYKDPACVLIGVSLEIAVKELTTRYSLAVAKLDRMNVDLCKAGAYNVAKQKQVTAWADLRNRSAHGEWATYTEADVREMLNGVQRFIADHL
jgi:HEPN domain-containing protein